MKSTDDVEALRRQLDDLKEMVEALKKLPDEVKSIRKKVKHLSANGGGGESSGVAVDDFTKLKEGCLKLQSNMKKQNGILHKELGEAKTKIEKQASQIKDYQRDIDALKMEIRDANKKVSTAVNEAKKAITESASSSDTTAKELAAAKSKLQDQEAKIQEQQREIDELKQTMNLLKEGQMDAKKTTTYETPSTIGPAPVNVKDDSSSSSDSDLSSLNNASNKDPDSESDEREAQARKQLEELRKKREDDSDFSDSDSPIQQHRSFLPRKPASFDDSDSEKEPEIASPQRAQRRGRERKFEAHNVPKGRKALDDVDDSDHILGEGDIEIDIDDDEVGQLPPQGTFNRRSSIASVESVESMDSAPRKKTISLLPHKSADIYEEQRKDGALRKLMLKSKSNSNMKVRKVHGKNLVFFSDRIYIPESMRRKSLEFYWDRCKKQKLNPLLHLEKNCFWPDMKEQYKKFDLEKSGKYVEVAVTYVKFEGTKQKEELNYDCVGLAD